MIDVDKTTFEEEVLKAEGYVFVDFFYYNDPVKFRSFS